MLIEKNNNKLIDFEIILKFVKRREKDRLHKEFVGSELKLIR